MNIPQTREEMWPVYDDRFPTVIDRALDQKYYDLVANMRKRKELINPLSVGKLGLTWPFIAGRKRLLAARALEQDGMAEYFAYVPVRVFRVKDMDEVIALRLSENCAGRSDNAAADFIAMRDLLKRLGSYKAVSEYMGIPVREIREMDNNLSTVPEKILQGVVEGTVALTTAIKVGKIENTQTKKAMVKRLAKYGKLTGAEVDETRQAIQKEATGKLTFVNTIENPSRTTFVREELVTALRLAEAEQATKTAAYLSGLVR